MARRPKKIIINENDYKLISRSKSWTAKHAAVGRIHYQPPLIEITNHDKNNIDLIDTVWHEILHGIVHEYEVPIDGRSEEKLVTILAHGLVDVCKSNPNLLLWILAKLGKTGDEQK